MTTFEGHSCHEFLKKKDCSIETKICKDEKDKEQWKGWVI